MKLNLGKVKTTISGLKSRFIPIRKRNKLTNEEIAFIKDNMESFRYYVKYEAVFKAFVKRVSEREIEVLNKEKKCRFRTESDVPFVIVCNIKEEEKMMTDCEDCKARTE